MDPYLRPYAEYAHAIAGEYGITPTITSVRRTWEDQARLRREWEAGRSQFPANVPGDSAHQYGLAWDSWVREEDRATWDAIRRWVGFRVPAHDWVHGELGGWRGYLQ
jgi:hypothetical protein